jgi:hypothetical protein
MIVAFDFIVHGNRHHGAIEQRQRVCFDVWVGATMVTTQVR